MTEPEPLALLLSDDVQTFLIHNERVYLFSPLKATAIVGKREKKANILKLYFFKKTIYFLPG